jgi:hypothetical protein
MTILMATNDIIDFPGATINADAGKFQAGNVPHALMVANGNAGVGTTSWTVIPQASGDIVWIHFIAYFDAANQLGDGTLLFELYDTAGAKIMDFDLLVGVPDLLVYGSTTETVSALSHFTQDKLIPIDVRVDITAPNIVVDLYRDNVLWISNTVTNNGKLKPEALLWKTFDLTAGNITDWLYVSEFIVADEDTRGMRLAEMTPSGAGNYSQWVGNHVETGDDDLSTGASSDTTGQKLSSTQTAYGGPATSAMRAVVVKNTVSTRGGVVNDIRNFVRISATDYNGAGLGVGEGITLLSTVWDQNPNTSADWGSADLAAIEIGVESLA